MRSLDKEEKEKLKIFTQNSISVALLEPTSTGLKKSILDATAPVRHYLKSNKIHNYESQSQGNENKVKINAHLIQPEGLIDSVASLYRPMTKNGDPRIWFRALNKYAKPNDVIGIIENNGELFIINLTELDISSLIYTDKTNPLKDLVYELGYKENTISNELLQKLKIIANKGFIPALVDADTAVGRTLETELGIPINSSKKPDYKGIELKSYRDNRGNRKNLFAQVANWQLSKFKSSAEILDNFGYWRGDDFKLYCTVSTQVRNSQGLQFKMNNNDNYLIENSDKIKIGDFAVWQLEKLHDRLLEKHNETFWIAANSKTERNREFFQFTHVEHTKKPIITQFDLLLEQGIITMDHLIKRNVKGVVKEKGPIFKIKENSLDLLFPPSKHYNLIKL